MSERTKEQIHTEIAALAEELTSLGLMEEGLDPNCIVLSWALCVDAQTMEDLDEEQEGVYVYKPTRQRWSTTVGLLQTNLSAILD